MKNTHKIVASLAGVVLLIAAAAAVVVVSFWTFSQIKEAAEAREHTYTVIIRAETLLSELKDAETGQRGYSLTGDKAFLEPYLAVRDSISGHLEELRQLTLISAGHKHLDAMAPLIVAKLAEMSHVIALRRNHDMAAVIAVVDSGQGKRLMDSIRAEKNSFIQIEEDALAQHEAEFQSNTRHLLRHRYHQPAYAAVCTFVRLFDLSRNTASAQEFSLSRNTAFARDSGGHE